MLLLQLGVCYFMSAADTATASVVDFMESPVYSSIYMYI